MRLRSATPVVAALAALALLGVVPQAATAAPGQEPASGRGGLGAWADAAAASAAPAADDAPVTVVEEAPLDVAADGLEEPAVLEAATALAPEAPVDGPPVTDIAVAGDTAAPAADAVVVGLSEPIDVPADQVSAVGATWLGDAGVQVDLRVHEAEAWGEWVTLEQEAAAEGEGAERHGTAPYLVTDDAVLQVRLLAVGGARPTDARLTLVGVGDEPIPLLENSVVVSETDAAARRSVKGTSLAADPVAPAEAPPAATAAVTGVDAGVVSAPRPRIHLRSEWGARAYNTAIDGPPRLGTVQAAVIHHTVSSNTYAQSQVPAMLRSIQAYHMNSRHWSDIGYNFLVDRFGTIWEGRQGGVERAIRGVHASEANGVSTGISVIGSHDVADVPRVTRDAVTRLVAWKLAVHGVPVGGTFVLGGRTLPNVIGHRDVPTAQTACPGKYLVRQLPTIRAGAASLQTFQPIVNNRSLSADDAVDVLLTGSPGSLVTLDADPVGAGTRIGNGWLPMDMVTIGPALRGGTTRDILAREESTGRLWIYHGNGAGSFGGRTALGTGWGAMSQVLSPGDFNGDGRGDIIAIEEATGLMWFYPGNGALKFGPRSRIGNGWGQVQAASTADVTGDRVPDVVGVLSDGSVKVYAGSGRGVFLSTTTVGRVSVPIDEIMVPGDLTFDGRPDLVLRDGSGDGMLTMPSTGTGRFGAATPWGSGWGDMHMLLSGAGWRGTTGRSILGIDARGYFYEYPAKSSVTWSTAAAPTLDADGAVLTAVVGDAVGSELADVLTTDASGNLFLHEARGAGTFAAPVQIGQGWGGMTELAGLGDLDADGAPEVLAKNRDGLVYVYPFDVDRSGALDDRYQVGNGFAPYTLVAAPDWNRNGGSTVFAINKATGALRVFAARAGTTLVNGATIGSGWHAFTDVVAVNNPSAPAVPALLARTPTGTTYLYLGDGNGGFGRRVAVTSITVPQGESLR